MEELKDFDNFIISKDRVIIKPINKEIKTSGGIIMTDSSTANLPGEATIMSLWTGHKQPPEDISMFLSVGDTVLYNQSNCIKIMHNGNEYIMTTIRDIYAKIINE